jgi:sugar-specific transcriptional regulator TrmB
MQYQPTGYRSGETVMLEAEVDALTSLGLTHVQSKVFLALAKSDCATVSSISELSKVPRQDIYRILSKLEELSLVEKMLTKPVRFQAVAMEEAWAILLKRKKEEYVRLRTVQKKFLQDFNKERQASSPEKSEYQFSVIKGKDALYRTIKENFSKSSKRIDIATTQERFLQSLTYLDDVYEKKLQQGMACRVVTGKPADEKAFLSSTKDIIRYPNFEFKYTLSPPKAIAVIFDEKTALAAMQVNEALLKSPIMYTNNPAFLAMFQGYFTKVWNMGILYDVSNNPNSEFKFEKVKAR